MATKLSTWDKLSRALVDDGSGNFTLNTTPIAGGAPVGAATLDDHTIIVTGTTTVTLPLANASPGQELEIINNDATLSTTIARAGSNTIEGATSKTLGARYSKVKLRSDGSSVWYIVSQQGTVT